jgi:hypothetical protein
MSVSAAQARLMQCNSFLAVKSSTIYEASRPVDDDGKNAIRECFGNGNTLWYSPNGSGLNSIALNQNPYYEGLNSHQSGYDDDGNQRTRTFHAVC